MYNKKFQNRRIYEKFCEHFFFSSLKNVNKFVKNICVETTNSKKNRGFWREKSFCSNSLFLYLTLLQLLSCLPPQLLRSLRRGPEMVGLPQTQAFPLASARWQKIRHNNFKIVIRRQKKTFQDKTSKGQNV